MEEGSKTLVIIGVVLGALCVLACLGGTFFFLFMGIESSMPPVPVTVAAAPVPVPPLTLAVAPDGGMWLDGEAVTEADLGAELESKPAGSELVIAADQAVPYAQLVKLIDVAKQAGIEKIALGVASGEQDPGGRDAG